MLDNLQVFSGDASPAEARIYARLMAEDARGCTLSGRVSGPTCVHAKTLPASFRLVDRGPGATLLAEAIVPDPCFWSPELPFLYQVEVELRRDQSVLSHTTRLIGLRPVGARGKRLHCEGKNWVLRAVARDVTPSTELPMWRESMTAMVVEQPEESLLVEASRTGVAIVATCLRSRTRQSSGGLPRDDALNSGEFGYELLRDELIRVSRHPCVTMFVTDSAHPPTREWRGLAPNVLLGQFAPHDSQPLGEATQIIWVDESALTAAWLAPLDRPVVVYRRTAAIASLLESRAECDQLQSDTAPRGAFAGYVLLPHSGVSS